LLFYYWFDTIVNLTQAMKIKLASIHGIALRLIDQDFARRNPT